LAQNGAQIPNRGSHERAFCPKAQCIKTGVPPNFEVCGDIFLVVEISFALMPSKHDDHDSMSTPDNTNTPTHDDQAATEQELRGHLKQTLIGLVLFFAVLGAIGMFYDKEIESICHRIFSMFGLSGLWAFIFVNDAIVSPLPPDLALIVFYKSEFKYQWYIWVTLCGLGSAAAGTVGWWLGGLLGKTKLPAYVFGAKLEQGKQLMRRYGSWSVAIGALTPVPFSLTTWTAGMLNVPLRSILIPCLLRVPRFIVYYWIAVAAFKL
jgi:membrane protein YqaA with SNARE-associated domain